MMPLTHWSEAALSTPLFSPQDGQPMQASVAPAGTRSITLGNGTTVTATGFKIATKNPVQDWYDSAKQWVSLHADAKDGSDVDYRRV